MTKQWWEIGPTSHSDAVPMVRAVAYYRHSAQDRQENSIPIPRDQVREWASKNGVEIIHEFADAGKSGLNAEGRPAFTEMMDEWVRQRSDFDYVLCLDVSRWGPPPYKRRAVFLDTTLYSIGRSCLPRISGSRTTRQSKSFGSAFDVTKLPVTIMLMVLDESAYPDTRQFSGGGENPTRVLQHT